MPPQDIAVSVLNSGSWQALTVHDEVERIPAPGLSWLRARFGERLPDGDDVWAMPCFFVRTRWRGRGVMSALIAAGVDLAGQHGLSEERPVVRYQPRTPNTAA